MKVLVTGASGFIGRHVLDVLDEHPEVSKIVASCRRLPDPESERATKPKRIWKPAELATDNTNWFEYFGRPDRLIHLAWGGLSNFKDESHLSDELPRHFSFLKNFIESGLKNLTVAGTCLEYGTREGALREDADLCPTTAYGKAKLQLFHQLDELCQKQDVSLKWPRIFYLYGDGQNPKSLLASLDRAVNNKDAVFNMSKGDQTRDFLPVESVAERIVAIAMQNKVEGPINCCSGQPVSVLQLVEERLKALNARIELNTAYYPYPDYETMHFWGDTTKLEKVLS